MVRTVKKPFQTLSSMAKGPDQTLSSMAKGPDQTLTSMAKGPDLTQSSMAKDPLALAVQRLGNLAGQRLGAPASYC